MRGLHEDTHRRPALEEKRCGLGNVIADCIMSAGGV